MATGRSGSLGSQNRIAIIINVSELKSSNRMLRPHRNRKSIKSSLVLAVPGVLVAGLVTLICFGLGASFTIAGFCYLIVVVLQSLAGDFRSTAVVSLLCVACLDYFFIPPLFSFRISDPSDTLALITFLATGIVVTRLVSLSREAAESEQLQRQEMTELYHVARSLLSLDPGISIGPELLKPFLTHFAHKAVCLFDGESAKLHTVGSSDDNLPQRTRTVYIENKNFEDPTTGVAIGLLQAGGKTMGAIGFEGLRDVRGTAGPLTALATLIIEKSLAFERASHEAARAEAEVFRGAILDALAHEFKTPLTTIVTAAGGIQAAGPLRSEQRQLAEAVESEGLRLEQLTSRLLRLARLDREEVHLQMELLDISEVLQKLVDQYSRRWPDRPVSLAALQNVATVGDKELLRLGIGQLLDNACKYSRPGSPVKIVIEESADQVVVDVWNAGTPIPANERNHIFDRFYRGTAAQKQAPGSGLGLYVARKIAHAHGGKVELDGSNEDQEGVRFRFTIPLANGEPKDACRLIREQAPQIGIVMATVRDSEADMVRALEAGADDYVTKPFRFGELVARLHAVLRRADPDRTTAPVLSIGNLEINFDRRTLHRSGEEVRLTPTEFDLLALLMKNEGMPLTHAKLLSSIWGAEYRDELEYLRTYVRSLRKKIEDDPSRPRYLLTEPWLGYRFQNPLADDTQVEQ